MKKWGIFAIIAILAVVAMVVLIILNEKTKSAEDTARKVELIYMGDGVALASKIYQLSTELSPESSTAEYDLGVSLKAELDAWQTEYEAVISENGAFSFLMRGSALDDLAMRRIELNGRIEAFLASE